jgi:hypothetical protein
MIRKSLLVLLAATLVSPPVVGCAQTPMPTPSLDPAERQTAIAEDEKYLDARFLGEVPIKDKCRDRTGRSRSEVDAGRRIRDHGSGSFRDLRQAHWLRFSCSHRRSGCAIPASPCRDESLPRQGA